MVNSHWRHDPIPQEGFVQELNVPLQAAGGPCLLGSSLLCKQKWRSPCTAVAGLCLPVLNLQLD